MGHPHYPGVPVSDSALPIIHMRTRTIFIADARPHHSSAAARPGWCPVYPCGRALIFIADARHHPRVPVLDSALPIIHMRTRTIFIADARLHHPSAAARPGRCPVYPCGRALIFIADARHHPRMPVLDSALPTIHMRTRTIFIADARPYCISAATRPERHPVHNPCRCALIFYLLLLVSHGAQLYSISPTNSCSVKTAHSSFLNSLSAAVHPSRRRAPLYHSLIFVYCRDLILVMIRLLFQTPRTSSDLSLARKNFGDSPNIARFGIVYF
ncbi:hypothetical protein R3P38DRAFT_3222829 [Favolaschia claudopus]|uniref:Uncharacterized protein n=1 Tax=Favolaschia claudopus TaxID=2862362 RepID=A0AAV9ZZ02_9AGAR